jgi:hypothetical protein
MGTLFLVLFIVGAASAYIGTAGFVGSKFYRARRSICPSCRGRGSCYSDHASAATLIGMFWVLTLPAIAGMILGGNGTGPRLSRADRRRANELDEARHQTELARERERAAQALDREERALGIR